MLPTAPRLLLIIIIVIDETTTLLHILNILSLSLTHTGTVETSFHIKTIFIALIQLKVEATLQRVQRHRRDLPHKGVFSNGCKGQLILL